MKKAVILVLFCLLMTGCRTAPEGNIDSQENKDAQILALEEERDRLLNEVKKRDAELEVLKIRVEELQKELDKYKQTSEFFPLLSNRALEFVRAHTTGDVDGVRHLLYDGILVEQIEGKMRASWTVDGQTIDWTLWEKDSPVQYQDMVIQGYGQLDDGTMLIHIREFYVQDEESVSPPTFLNLHFQKREDDWKIVYFEFDV